MPTAAKPDRPRVDPDFVHPHAKREGNLAGMMGWRRPLTRGGIAVLSGIALAGAWPPLDWGWLAWIGLVPLLWLGLDRNARSGWLGYFFGVAHFTASFAWLRVTMPPMSYPFPFVMALYLGLYPMLWLRLTQALAWNLRLSTQEDLKPRTDPRLRPFERRGPGRDVALALLAAALWTALEWLRSVLVSGMPWNHLGVSQWDTPYLLPLTRFTGVYGITFLIVAVNVGLYLALRNLWELRANQPPTVGQATAKPTTRVPVALLTALALVALAGLAGLAYRLPPPTGSIRIAAVQGNMPQMRDFSEAELYESMDVYFSLSRQVVAAHHPDLLVWPETAIPAALRNDRRTLFPFLKLLAELQTPIIVGSIDLRVKPDAPDDWLDYNSALCFQPDGRVEAVYDKIALVPFGEYVPFEETFPKLNQLIGMGRSLLPGETYTVWEPRPDVRLGFNLCFDEVFPHVTNGMVKHGANILITLTNDAWYEETAGTSQHTQNAMFRAVESLRPMLRNGNNSDTVLIMPDGRFVNHLRDPATGSIFTRQAGVYEVPVWTDLPITFYTRYGNLFAGLNLLVALAVAAWCFWRRMDRRRRLFRLMVPPRPGEDPAE